MRRRHVLAAAAALAPPALVAQPRGLRLDQRLRCGAELSLMASGLARALQGAFGRDTGLAMQLVAAPATALLGAARDGEVDCALSNAPAEEAVLEQQGLLHSRLRIATGSFLVVGPTTAAPLSARSVAGALGEIAGGRASGEVPFLTPGDGSAAHLAELRLWQAAGVEPRAPWHRAAQADRSVADQVRRGGAWAVVERGAWLAAGGAVAGRSRIVLQDDPLLEVPVHALRSFRSPHPAGKLWSTWVGGPRGRAVAGARQGYRRAV
jgi:tungstate transport system substrate-binding protein